MHVPLQFRLPVGQVGDASGGATETSGVAASGMAEAAGTSGAAVSGLAASGTAVSAGTSSVAASGVVASGRAASGRAASGVATFAGPSFSETSPSTTAADMSADRLSTARGASLPPSTASTHFHSAVHVYPVWHWSWGEHTLQSRCTQESPNAAGRTSASIRENTTRRFLMLRFSVVG